MQSDDLPIEYEMDMFFIFIKDILVVSIGVFLGLLVERWRESRRNRSFILKAIKSIAEGVKENRRDLELSIKNHERLLHGVMEVKPWEKVSMGTLMRRLSPGGGISLPLTRRKIGRQLFTGEQASLLPPSLLMLLEDMDIATEYMLHLMDKLNDHLIQRWDSTLYVERYRFAIQLHAIILMERQILNLYDRFLRSVGKDICSKLYST